MLARLNRLLIALLLVGGALYIAAVNRSMVTVTFTSERNFTASLGVILIAAFAIGILIATLVAGVFAIRAHFRERSIIAKDRQKQQFIEKLAEARSAAACENWEYAQLLWEQLLKRDPSFVIARSEAAKTLSRKGDLKGALKLLDDARAAHPDNAEILFRAAELQVQLNNKTAAVDNVALVLAKHRSRRAARLAMHLSEDLGRYDEALEFHKQLESFGEFAPLDGTRLQFKRISERLRSKPTEYKKELASFVKANPTCFDAVVALAKLEEEAGKLDDASQLYMRAARESGRFSLWTQAQDMWLNASKPDKALAVVRSARTELKGDNRVAATLEIIRLYIRLAMLGEAHRELDEFPRLVEGSVSAPRSDLLAQYFVLKALYYELVGNFKEGAQALRQLDEFYKTGRFVIEAKPAVVERNGIEPYLSTP